MSEINETVEAVETVEAAEVSPMEAFTSMFGQWKAQCADLQRLVDIVDNLDDVYCQIDEATDELRGLISGLENAAAAAGLPFSSSDLDVPAPTNEWRLVGLKCTQTRVARLRAIYEAAGMTEEQFAPVAASTSSREEAPGKIRQILLGLKRAGLVQTGQVEGTPKTGPRAVFTVNESNSYVREWLGLDA